MNGPIRLAMHIDTRPINSPTQNISGIFEGEQFLLNFAELFAAVEDGDSADNADSNIEDDLLPPEIATSQTEAPEPIKPDLEIPLLPASPAGAPEIVTEAHIGNAVPEISKVTDETPSIEGKSRQDEAPLDKPVAGNVHARFGHAENLKAAPVIAHQRELPPESTDSDLVQGKAVLPTDKVIEKEIQIALATGFEKPADPQQQPKTAPLRDSSNSLLPPLAPSGPMAQAVPPVVINSAPIVAAAPILAPMPASTPAFPVLDIEASSQWIAKLSQDIGNLSAEKPVLNFQLKPEHLGKLSVRITAGTAGDVVRLETENENVKALLIGAQGRLEQDIRLSGLKLSRVDVTVQDHPGSQLGQKGSGSRESGTGTGPNGDARPQEYTAQQSSLIQHGPDVAAANGPAATSSYHGARYA